jgi:AsmA family protein
MTETATAVEPATADTQAETSDRSRRDKKGGPPILRWIGGIFGALILAIVIFLLLFNWDWFRPPLAKMLSAKLHRPVKIVGHLRVHLLTWTPTVTLGGLQIGQPGWAPERKDFADFDQITVKMKLLPLLTGHVILPLIQVDHPQIDMYQAKNGRSNWDFSDGKKAGKPAKLPPIQNFVINDGKLAITSLQRKLEFSGTVNAHDSTTGAGQGGFHMGGTGQLNGKPFLMNVTGGPLLNVKPNVAYPFNARVSAGDTVVTAKGQVPHPFNLGQVFADVSLSGRDLADIYYLTGITLPNTPPYSIAGHLSRDEKVYSFDRFHGRVGSSDLEGHLKADMSSNDNRPDLTGALVSQRLDFKDLGSLFGATGRNKPAAPHIAAVQPTPAAGHRLLPDAPLDASRIRSMDADVTYKAETVVASPNLPLRGVDLGVKLDHGLLSLNPIRFKFPQGQLAGNAAINARGAVQRNAVDLRVSGIQMQQFLAAKGGKAAGGPPPVEGVLDAHARLSGDGDTVHKAAATSNGEVVAVIPGGVIRQAFAELLSINATKGIFQLLNKDQHQTDIRCAVADFQVRNGVLQARQIIIDTGVVQVKGQGNVNLNDETLNLTFTGDSKQFRLVHLDAPITVGGHLSSPAFGIKPAGPAIQAGIGAALGAIVFPPLAILPFIDPGLAKNANCAAVLQVAKSAGAPVKASQVRDAPHAGKPH